MPSVKLQSSDGEIFDVDVKVAKVSVTIKNMLDDLGIDEGDNEAIPIPNVTGAIMKKVIEWATQHKDDDPLPEDDGCKEKVLEDISIWDKEFLPKEEDNRNHSTLFQLLLAANYLDIKGLLDITCKTVALKIKGKKVEDIRATFNIKNDFDPEEEAAILKESEWCENAC